MLSYCRLVKSFNVIGNDHNKDNVVLYASYYDEIAEWSERQTPDGEELFYRH